MIAVNKKYLPRAAVMLKSLSMAVTEKITVYMFASSLSAEDTDNFAAKMKKFGIDVLRVDVKDKAFSDMPVKKFSVEMYYRLVAQFMLPDDVERILWLDADIVIINDISEFYHRDFDDKFMVVCRDMLCGSDKISDIKKRVGISDGAEYFNSGVLLLNLQKLRAETTMEHIIEVCDEKKDLVEYPDQDILNFLYQGKVKYANDRIYNCQTPCVPKETIKRERKNIAVLHYCGPVKPWEINGICTTAKYWWKCALGKIKGTIFFYSVGVCIIGVRKISRLFCKKTDNT